MTEPKVFAINGRTNQVAKRKKPIVNKPSVPSFKWEKHRHASAPPPNTNELAAAERLERALSRATLARNKTRQFTPINIHGKLADLDLEKMYEMDTRAAQERNAIQDEMERELETYFMSLFPGDEILQNLMVEKRACEGRAAQFTKQVDLSNLAGLRDIHSGEDPDLEYRKVTVNKTLQDAAYHTTECNKIFQKIQERVETLLSQINHPPATPNPTAYADEIANACDEIEKVYMQFDEKKPEPMHLDIGPRFTDKNDYMTTIATMCASSSIDDARNRTRRNETIKNTQIALMQRLFKKSHLDVVRRLYRRFYNILPSSMTGVVDGLLHDPDFDLHNSMVREHLSEKKESLINLKKSMEQGQALLHDFNTINTTLINVSYTQSKSVLTYAQLDMLGSKLNQWIYYKKQRQAIGGGSHANRTQGVLPEDDPSYINWILVPTSYRDLTNPEDGTDRTTITEFYNLMYAQAHFLLLDDLMLYEDFLVGGTFGEIQCTLPLSGLNPRSSDVLLRAQYQFSQRDWYSVESFQKTYLYYRAIVVDKEYMRQELEKLANHWLDKMTVDSPLFVKYQQFVRNVSEEYYKEKSTSEIFPENLTPYIEVPIDPLSSNPNISARIERPARQGFQWDRHEVVELIDRYVKVYRIDTSRYMEQEQLLRGILCGILYYYKRFQQIGELLRDMIGPDSATTTTSSSTSTTTSSTFINVDKKTKPPAFLTGTSLREHFKNSVNPPTPDSFGLLDDISYKEYLITLAYLTRRQLNLGGTPQEINEYYNTATPSDKDQFQHSKIAQKRISKDHPYKDDPPARILQDEYTILSKMLKADFLFDSASIRDLNLVSQYRLIPPPVDISNPTQEQIEEVRRLEFIYNSEQRLLKKHYLRYLLSDFNKVCAKRIQDFYARTRNNNNTPVPAPNRGISKTGAILYLIAAGVAISAPMYIPGFLPSSWIIGTLGNKVLGHAATSIVPIVIGEYSGIFPVISMVLKTFYNIADDWKREVSLPNFLGKLIEERVGMDHMGQRVTIQDIEGWSKALEESLASAGQVPIKALEEEPGTEQDKTKNTYKPGKNGIAIVVQNIQNVWGNEFFMRELYHLPTKKMLGSAFVKTKRGNVPTTDMTNFYNNLNVFMTFYTEGLNKDISPSDVEGYENVIRLRNFALIIILTATIWNVGITHNVGSEPILFKPFPMPLTSESKGLLDYLWGSDKTPEKTTIPKSTAPVYSAESARILYDQIVQREIPFTEEEMKELRQQGKTCTEDLRPIQRLRDPLTEETKASIESVQSKCKIMLTTTLAISNSRGSKINDMKSVIESFQQIEDGPTVEAKYAALSTFNNRLTNVQRTFLKDIDLPPADLAAKQLEREAGQAMAKFTAGIPPKSMGRYVHNLVYAIPRFYYETLVEMKMPSLPGIPTFTNVYETVTSTLSEGVKNGITYITSQKAPVILEKLPDDERDKYLFTHLTKVQYEVFLALKNRAGEEWTAYKYAYSIMYPNIAGSDRYWTTLTNAVDTWVNTLYDPEYVKEIRTLTDVAKAKFSKAYSFFEFSELPMQLAYNRYINAKKLPLYLEANVERRLIAMSSDELVTEMELLLAKLANITGCSTETDDLRRELVKQIANAKKLPLAERGERENFVKNMLDSLRGFAYTNEKERENLSGERVKLEFHLFMYLNQARIIDRAQSTDLLVFFDGLSQIVKNFAAQDSDWPAALRLTTTLFFPLMQVMIDKFSHFVGRVVGVKARNILGKSIVGIAGLLGTISRVKEYYMTGITNMFRQFNCKNWLTLIRYVTAAGKTSIAMCKKVVDWLLETFCMTETVMKQFLSDLEKEQRSNFPSMSNSDRQNFHLYAMFLYKPGTRMPMFSKENCRRLANLRENEYLAGFSSFVNKMDAELADPIYYAMASIVDILGGFILSVVWPCLKFTFYAGPGGQIAIIGIAALLTWMLPTRTWDMSEDAFICIAKLLQGVPMDSLPSAGAALASNGLWQLFRCNVMALHISNFGAERNMETLPPTGNKPVFWWESYKMLSTMISNTDVPGVILFSDLSRVVNNPLVQNIPGAVQNIPSVVKNLPNSVPKMPNPGYM